MSGGTDNDQHKISSKDMVAVATAIEIAAAGTALTVQRACQQLPWALAKMELPLPPLRAQKQLPWV
jgi:hypothetical protein